MLPRDGPAGHYGVPTGPAAILGKIPAMVQKKVRKKFGQFFGRFQREEASSFLALTPPEFFTFPGGGLESNPQISGPPLTPISRARRPTFRPAKNQFSI